MAKSLILLSGGLDSALLANRLLRQSVELNALFIDVGQTSAAAELAAARRVTSILDLQLDVVDGRSLRQAFVSSALSHYINVPNPGRHVLPLGSMLFFGVTLPYADKNSFGSIFVGYTTADAEFGTEYGQPWLDHLAELAKRAGRPPLKIEAPLQKLKLSDLAEGQRVDELIDATYSCIQAGPEPCGACRSCVSRSEKIDSLRRETKRTR